MASEEFEPVAVSRRIDTPAADIFRVLADPRRHPDLDGSGMVRGSGSSHVISGVGDVFVMKMYYSELGDYEMNNHIVEFELTQRFSAAVCTQRVHTAARNAGFAPP